MTATGRRVLVIEDDAMVRGWVRLALEGTAFQIAGEAASAAEAEELVTRRRADVLLVDYRLPDESGTELVRRLRRLGVDAPAVLMTASRVEGLNEVAREAGAQGTVLKSGDADDLTAALRRVAAGKRAFDPRHPSRRATAPPLSPREREVLRLVAAGRTNSEIAQRLGVGVETAKGLVERTFRKLGARRRAEAVAAAYERGLL